MRWPTKTQTRGLTPLSALGCCTARPRPPWFGSGLGESGRQPARPGPPAQTPQTLPPHPNSRSPPPPTTTTKPLPVHMGLVSERGLARPSACAHPGGLLPMRQATWRSTISCQGFPAGPAARTAALHFAEQRHRIHLPLQLRTCPRPPAAAAFWRRLRCSRTRALTHSKHAAPWCWLGCVLPHAAPPPLSRQTPTTTAAYPVLRNPLCTSSSPLIPAPMPVCTLSNRDL